MEKNFTRQQSFPPKSTFQNLRDFIPNHNSMKLLMITTQSRRLKRHSSWSDSRSPCHKIHPVTTQFILCRLSVSESCGREFHQTFTRKSIYVTQKKLIITTADSFDATLDVAFPPVPQINCTFVRSMMFIGLEGCSTMTIAIDKNLKQTKKNSTSRGYIFRL
jgi:hypothetical protein